MTLFLYLVVLSLVVYRVSRFIVLDSLIDGTRDRFKDWLMRKASHLWARKLFELLGCPYCVTIWVSAGAIAVSLAFVPSVPLPVFMWLAASGGALVVWGFVDSEEGKDGSG